MAKIKLLIISKWINVIIHKDNLTSFIFYFGASTMAFYLARRLAFLDNHRDEAIYNYYMCSVN